MYCEWQLCEDLVVKSRNGSKVQQSKAQCACKKSSCGCTNSSEGKKKRSLKKASRKAPNKKVITAEDKGKGAAMSKEEKHLSVLAQIESLMTQLQDQKNKITMKRSTSPQESSKAHKSKAKNIKDPVKVKQVGGGKRGGRDLSSDSSTPVACPSASGSMMFSDPLSLGTWDIIRDVPPCQVNNMAHPIGQYWKHMKNFAFERAAFTFPWHVDWSQQDSLTKVRFKLRLKKLYPGDWDEAYVMQMIGNNIRERRVRLRRTFARALNKNSVPVAGGVTIESWNAIFESLSNPKYQAKSDKCKVAANERTMRKGFTHKLGPRGVQGLVTTFVSKLYSRL